MEHSNAQDRLDRATSHRLARLAARPVDVSRLGDRVSAGMSELGEPSAAPVLPVRRQRWWGPILSAAAAVVIVGAVGLVLLGRGGSQAMAAPAELAHLHAMLAGGSLPNLRVASVDEANRLLADQRRGAVPMPELPGAMMSCCLREHAGTTLTCALIERHGLLISVAVADGERMHSPEGRLVRVGGREFVHHTDGDVEMVMTQRDGRWLCVMGRATPQALAEVASQIRF